MKKQFKQSQLISHTMQLKTGVIQQAPVKQILQRYQDKIVQRQNLKEEELFQCKFEDSVQLENDQTSVIQKLSMHGSLLSGKFGILNGIQMRNWIINKSNRQMNPANVNQCVTDILNHLGGNGNFHVSHGQMNGNQGCTVFFKNPDQDTVKIFAIGWHHTNDSYRLDWASRGSGLFAGDICDVNGNRI